MLGSPVGKNAYSQYICINVIYRLYAVEINPEVRMIIVTIHAKCVEVILSS